MPKLHRFPHGYCLQCPTLSWNHCWRRIEPPAFHGTWAGPGICFQQHGKGSRNCWDTESEEIQLALDPFSRANETTLEVSAPAILWQPQETPTETIRKPISLRQVNAQNCEKVTQLLFSTFTVITQSQKTNTVINSVTCISSCNAKKEHLLGDT